MLMSLRDIFNSLTPANLNEIPLINVAKEIFINCIERNSRVAKRITDIFDLTERDSDTEMINRAKKNLKIGLYQTYIYGLYKYLQALTTSPEMLNDLKKYHYENSALYKDIFDIINTEFIQSHHIFTQKIGTTNATHYMYNFSKYLETGTMQDDLEIEEGNPFIIHYEGSLGRRLYNEFTRPQTHPIGWLDNYETVFSLIFQDYFGIEILDDITKIELHCNESWVVFIKDNNIQSVKDDFSNRINPITMQPYTPEEISRYVTIVPNKVVSTYRRYIDDTNSIITVFTFVDQTVLYHNESSPKITYYTTYQDYLNNFQNPIEVWDECWELESEMQTNFRFLYEDNHEFFKDHFITMIKDYNQGGVGLTCYNEQDPNYMFKVQGKEIQHIIGVDESKNKCLNYDDQYQKVQDKFTATFDAFLETVSDIEIKDQYGHSKKWAFQDTSQTYSLNTHDFGGTIYSIYINDYIYEPYGYETTGLNDFKRKIWINDVKLDYSKCIISGIIKDKNLNINNIQQINFDSLLDQPNKNKQYYLQIDFQYISSVHGNINVIKYLDINDDESFNYNFQYIINDNSSEFKFSIKQFKQNGKFITEQYYKGPVVSRPDDLYAHVGLLKWNNYETNINIEIEKLEKIEDMPNYNDYHPNVPGHIGERPPLDNSTYYLPLKLKQDYVQNGVIGDFSPYISDGKLLIGVPYEKSNYNNFKEDNIFINLGFKDTCLDSSELYITDSPNFVQDELEFDQHWEEGYYLYSDFSQEINDYPGSYLYSRDKFYLYTYEQNPDDDFQVIVYFELDGGVSMNQLIIQQNATFSMVKDSFGWPVKEGYEFSHWSLEKGGNEISNTYRFEDNTTIYANYTLADVTITMKVGNAEWV